MAGHDVVWLLRGCRRFKTLRPHQFATACFFDPLLRAQFMVKMIPYHLISKKFEKHPHIEMLSKHGFFSFDEAKP